MAEMRDKRRSLDEAVAGIESGMTIGMGGWGGRRKPLALVRALMRSDVTDLTVVGFLGADLGLLISAGKVKRAYYGFVSLDSAPFYDPWFAKARLAGTIESREMDEGMVKTGLQAAAARLPFMPTRAGLGSDAQTVWGDELKTVESPYPNADGRTETLIAMPALKLDAALVHLDLADSRGNAAYTGVDPYFDDLFCLAADQRIVSAEKIVSTEELVAAVPRQALILNRAMVDSVSAAPNGAHFTFAGGYKRDEKFQRHYAESAKTDEGWQEFTDTYLSGGEAGYQAAVQKFAEESQS